MLKIRLVFAVLLPAAAYQSPLPTDCSDIYRGGAGVDGVYTIYPAGSTSPVQVYCDMSKDDIDNSAEKWTVIQRRQDGTVNFFKKWEHYKTGFGSAAGEYWLGLETMHLLTQRKNYELKVDMEDFEGQKVFAHYSSFSVGPESDGYKLNLGSFIKGACRNLIGCLATAVSVFSQHLRYRWTRIKTQQLLNSPFLSFLFTFHGSSS
uniref:Zgc:171687 n=1 Tax=Pundamilia nyererei TaxID=303518 RepID=A0A3B4EY85_9CICH